MKKVLLISFCLLLCAVPAFASKALDSDRDGISDKDEINIYKTDVNNSDTDGDGYSDWVELNQGYAPLNYNKIKLEESDYDKDGLSDRMELNFHTDLSNPDTDCDGYDDGVEIKKGCDPLNAEPAQLAKRIEINIAKQELSYFLGGVRLGSFSVSTGKASMPTPKGEFQIGSKSPRAWSSYGLWMPWWMGIKNCRFGIHELPEWPGGYKEGKDHLGKPVSHGCIRLGMGPAELLYEWTPVGTRVDIY